MVHSATQFHKCNWLIELSELCRAHTGRGFPPISSCALPNLPFQSSSYIYGKGRLGKANIYMYLAVPAACRSSQAKDLTHATAATKPQQPQQILNPLGHWEIPFEFFPSIFQVSWTLWGFLVTSLDFNFRFALHHGKPGLGPKVCVCGGLEIGRGGHSPSSHWPPSFSPTLRREWPALGP